MKNIGLLLSSVVVIGCCVMSSEVRAVIPKTKLGGVQRTGKIPSALTAKVGVVHVRQDDSHKFAVKSLFFDLDDFAKVNNVKKNDYNGGKFYDDHLRIPFHISGRQPTTEDAAVYSGARVTDEELNKKITSWYMYVFGGKDVEPYADVKITAADNVFPKFAPDGRNIINFDEEQIKTEIRKRVIKRKNIAEETEKKFIKFKESFWTSFKTMASDPVGRVLLYRLLIEIWRTNEGGEGDVEYFDGDKAFYFDDHKADRNKCRSINIQFDDGASFSKWHQYIRINPNHERYRDPDQGTTVVSIHNKEHQISKTVGGKEVTCSRELHLEPGWRPADVSLFHEMLHWFLFLRNTARYSREKTNFDEKYAYALQNYYGDKDTGLAGIRYWRARGGVLSGSEVRVILGMPDVEKYGHLLPDVKKKKGFEWERDTKFLRGDDLSENVYRLSRYTSKNPIYMRFGHTSGTKITVDLIDDREKALAVTTGKGFHMNTFEIAYNVAMDCYEDIVGTRKTDWNLCQEVDVPEEVAIPRKPKKFKKRSIAFYRPHVTPAE